MRILSYCFALLWLTSCVSNYDANTLDLLLTNGLITTGQGEAPQPGAIGIKGDSIVFVGEIPETYTRFNREIDVEGRWIAPGFIDPHTHLGGYLNDSLKNTNQGYLFQGVTTVFVGNDGGGSLYVDQQFKKWEQNGIGTNAALYVGHGSLRRAVMGMQDREPNEEEMETMKGLLRQGLEHGALGLSCGLYYAPGSYATTEEVIELAHIVKEFNGIYDVHLRDESSYNIGLIGAVEETIEIAKAAGIPGHIAHIKCLGVDVWGMSDSVIQIVEEARANGIQITADQYPYNASGSSIAGALIPRWVLADDPEPIAKFEDVTLRSRIMDEMEENLRRRGGPESLLLTYPSEKNRDLKGLTLGEVAEKWRIPPIEAAVRIFINGGSSAGSFNMQESDIERFMSQPWVMTGSDGSAGHPRKYGTYPKKISHYIMKQSVMPLEKMIQQSTSLPAITFQLTRRGLLRPGYFADIIVFDPEEVKDHATFEDPTALSSGMEYVIVNGRVTIDQGQFTGEKAGRALRHEAN